ncbi:hypothetical protein [Actinoplanes sp. NBRC 101535]|uniref:hypothetical protein n=1 Tax=Actinoplanes sp. NBRC 101535 TaxID=3032196 RepID=UPI00255678E6|nr:hypothetical protein [Actinoplanes sp. NBRC 101535]
MRPADGDVITFGLGYLPDRIGWREITAVGDHLTVTESSVPSSSVSGRLTSYPAGTANLDVREARLTVRAGGPAQGSSTGDLGAGGRQDRVADRLTRWFTGLAGSVRLNWGIGVLALLGAVILGGAHALAPGHGKTVMAAYLVGTRGRLSHALWTGVTVTITHTVGVLFLGVALATTVSLAPGALYAWLRLISGLLIAAVGGHLLWRASSARRTAALMPASVHVHSVLGGQADSPVHTGPSVRTGPSIRTGPPLHVDASANVDSSSRIDAPARVDSPVHTVVADHAHGACRAHEHPHEHVDHHPHEHGDQHAYAHPHEHGDHHAHAYPHEHGDKHAYEHADHSAHEHQGSSGHTHAHGGWVHTHPVLPVPVDGEPFRARTVLAIGLAGGLAPSPSAVVVLLGAIALGRTWFGVLLVVAYGTGLALVLIGIGLALARWGERLRPFGNGRLARTLRHRMPTLTAGVILLAGIGTAVLALATISV